ncbi:MAG TPA: YkgJ family cysteine cluster protein [Gammaproteobacteria bacterium]|nr:YkgJ family cysteine cluster protein [Gammaproteobacteria bacterium]
MTAKPERSSDVDCDAGRRRGCGTFCCRLLVRLKEHELEPSPDGTPAKRFVDKDEEGYCVHFDRESCLCSIWERRPQTCREYSCNEDFLLQVAVREGFSNIADLARKAATTYVPVEQYVSIPYRRS